MGDPRETNGSVTWITGLSGAGKTSVAGELVTRLRCAGYSPVLLDGDELRRAFGSGARFDAAGRQELAMAYARLCGLLSGQGHIVACATISLWHEVQAWNRKNLPGYLEILLDVPLRELRRRDPKGVYRGAGEVVGVDVSAEFPVDPDLRIGNHGTVTPGAAANTVFEIGARRGMWKQ